MDDQPRHAVTLDTAFRRDLANQPAVYCRFHRTGWEPILPGRSDYAVICLLTAKKAPDRTVPVGRHRKGQGIEKGFLTSWSKKRDLPSRSSPRSRSIVLRSLSLIHISEPTRQAEISY